MQLAEFILDFGCFVLYEYVMVGLVSGGQSMRCVFWAIATSRGVYVFESFRARRGKVFRSLCSSESSALDHLVSDGHLSEYEQCFGSFSF